MLVKKKNHLVNAICGPTISELIVNTTSVESWLLPSKHRKLFILSVIVLPWSKRWISFLGEAL